MLFKDYKKSYVDFCSKKIFREIMNGRKKYFRDEFRAKNECILNEYTEHGDEKVELYVGETDVNIDRIFGLTDNIEDKDVSKSTELLSAKEQKVVSLRIEAEMPYEEIRIYIGSRRKQTPCNIYCRAINKMRENIEKRKRENK